MVESAAHRKLIGNAYLARELATRNPSFLRRNLRRALDGHKRDLAALRSKETGESGPLHDMAATERRDAGWNYPTVAMLKDLVKGQKPVLQISGLQLRRADATGTHTSASTHHTTRRTTPVKPATDELDWLPDASVDFRTDCRVTARILQPAVPAREIYVETKTGTIESSGIGSSPRHFDVTLEKPIHIEVEQLYTAIDTGKVGVNRWKRSIPLDYELRVEIKCQDLSGTMDFLDLLEGRRPTADQLGRSDKEGVVKLNWSSFPECPPANKLLPLKRKQNHKSLDLKYGAELSMGWLSQQDTPLERYNRLVREYKVKTSRPPTPVTSDRMEITPPDHVITYVYQQAQHVCKHLRCPLCAVPGMPGVAHTDFDRLHMHLLLHHGHFHFEIEYSKVSPSLVEKIIILSATARTREIFREPSPGDEETWIAPSGPFDEKAYLAGKDTWTNHQQPQKGTTKAMKANGRKSANASPSKPGKLAATPQHQMNGVVPPTPATKLHPVPEVPGIRFYASISKCPLNPGSLLPSPNSSSINLTWLSQRLHDDISNLPISDATKEFWKAWNAHLDSENLCGETYLAGSLERFKQKWRTETAGRWRDDFIEFVLRLGKHGIVGQEASDALLNGIANGVPNRKDDDAPKCQTNGVLTNGHHAKPASKKPPATRTCTCGKPVTSNRGVIICADTRCRRVHFHKDCFFALMVYDLGLYDTNVKQVSVSRGGSSTQVPL
ncbi:hypothetical protein B0A48_14687 [Cryoendolithus antarcticus]|uniref:Polycomb protein VEFS-Box domain-containing protein n=1 Tax=Cryoendolithus antarcticus TaxID=1507870 RepID=A0A1V8SK67_9PEZI|nr:hypothetical protein B0A48_14687 [Cryoendolithus antarcticus]